MSQYQRGSYVQLSRNDRDVIEVRMNPSTYPVTIANLNHIRLLLPELSSTFFTVTINRTDKNFEWTKQEDKDLLYKLRTVGMLTYTGMFETIPRSEKPEEVDFGNVYLGQTVKLHQGKYGFDGMWTAGEGEHGQLAVYAGHGNAFPRLAYYLSMALTNPNVLGAVHKDFWPQVKTLQDALRVDPTDGKNIFRSIQNRIQEYRRLREADQAGKQIVELLNPRPKTTL